MIIRVLYNYVRLFLCLNKKGSSDIWSDTNWGLSWRLASWYSYNGRIILLVVLLYVVPTECTDYTEAYGIKVFRIHRMAYASRCKNPQKWMLAGLCSVGTTSKGDTSTRAFRRHRRQPCLTSGSSSGTPRMGQKLLAHGSALGKRTL